MNIEYQPDAKRARDLDSGMAVEFVGFGLYARERDMSFVLYWKSKAIPLKGSYDVDEARIIKENRTLGPGELGMAIWDAGIRNVCVHSNERLPRRFLSDADGNVLVRLVQRLVKEATPECKIVNVRLWVTGFLSMSNWSVWGDESGSSLR